MTLAALLLLSSFDAGACSCTRMTVLPDGSVCRPGQLEIGLDQFALDVGAIVTGVIAPPPLPVDRQATR